MGGAGKGNVGPSGVGGLMSLRAQVLAASVGVGAAAVPIPGGVQGIPERALVAYVQAAASAPCPVPWWDLAAIGAAESGHGTHGGSSLNDEGKVPLMPSSWAGAEGPMQFMPDTWSRYGIGDVYDIDDAAPATARMLCADGYMTDRTNAIGMYNGGAGWRGYRESNLYVAKVDEFADAYRHAAPAVTPVGPGKERTPARLGTALWNGLVRSWLRVGEMSRVVPGGEKMWRATDDGIFGADVYNAPVLPVRADGFDPTFGAKLDAFLAAQPGITVYSGKRSPEEQLVLWNRAQAGQGAPAGWSDGTSCESKHCEGLAADLTFVSQTVEDWAHANSERYGLWFPYSHEPWHVELAS